MAQRTIDLIRASAAPATVFRMAARGALAVPPVEALEILVYLAQHNKQFGEQAAMTLAGWDEAASIKVVGDPATPKEVLDYFIHPQNLRPALLPTLIENLSVSEEALEKVARAVTGASLDMLLGSTRVASSPKICAAIKANLNLNQTQSLKLRELMGEPARTTAQPAETQAPSPVEKLSVGAGASSPQMSSSEEDADVAKFLVEHAAEVAQEGDKPFQPLGAIHEEFDSEASTAAAHVAAPVAESSAAAPKKAAVPPAERGSTLQKIAALGIHGRIQLAMKGTKEERSLLIRDGTKIVALAVLESPKISDGEVEKIASQKNVLEAVLRQIPMKRRFAKNYVVIRNLVGNPRTPLDVALGLMKNLMINDLKALSGNKEVPETIRKLALRQFKQKSDDANKK
jgi:hypothetical protein